MLVVGDRVKDYLTFDIGTIIKIDHSRYFAYTVQLDCGLVEWYMEKELILVSNSIGA